MSRTAAWMRGAIEGVPAMLQPVAHALVEAAEELEELLADATAAELAERPGGAASAAYHVVHMLGSLDRLITYAEGRMLDDAQLAALRAEKEVVPIDGAALLRHARERLDAAMTRVRAVEPETLTEPREVGRARLPSTVIGLLFHAAEHTTRHVGQVATTLKVVRGQALATRAR